MVTNQNNVSEASSIRGAIFKKTNPNVFTFQHFKKILHFWICYKI